MYRVKCPRAFVRKNSLLLRVDLLDSGHTLTPRTEHVLLEYLVHHSKLTCLSNICTKEQFLDKAVQFIRL